MANHKLIPKQLRSIGRYLTWAFWPPVRFKLFMVDWNWNPPVSVELIYPCSGTRVGIPRSVVGGRSENPRGFYPPKGGGDDFVVAPFSPNSTPNSRFGGD